MANEKLRYYVTMDSKGFVQGVNRAQKSTAKLGTGKGKNKSGAAINQLAYALDDAQYGFQGVQNNLQAIAVQAGAGGPIVLALTVLVIAIGYVIEHWEDFQTESQKATQNAIDFATAIAKAGGLNASLEAYADILQDSTSSTIAKTDALKRLKSNGYDPATDSLEEFLKVKKREIALDAVASVLSKKNLEAAEKFAKAEGLKLEMAERQRRFDALGPNVALTEYSPGQGTVNTLAGQLKNSINSLKKEITELEAEGVEIQKRAAIIYEKIVRSLTGADSNTTATEFRKNIEEIAKEYDVSIEGLADYFDRWVKTGESGFDKLNELFSMLPPEIRAKLSLLLKDLEKDVKPAGAALQQAIGSAFGDIGASIGEALAGDGDIGTKFLQTLGKFMQSFGAALIALGIAEAEWLKTFNPGQKIIAGVALVVAGAAISASYSKKSGGGSSASVANLSQPSKNLGSQKYQQENQGALVFVGKTRGQETRYILDAARDSYQARG